MVNQRVTLFITALLLTVGTACGGESEPTPEHITPTPTPTLTTITPEPQDDSLMENVSERLDFVREGVYRGSDGLGGATWLDYDRDGFLDLYITNANGLNNALFRNNGDGTFTDMAIEAGVANRAEAAVYAVRHGLL